MNLTGLLWLALFVTFAIASVRRPAYAVICHVMVFFLNPLLWWFGDGLLSGLTDRWSVVAVAVMGLAVGISFGRIPKLSRAHRRYLLLLALMSLNALFVHEFLAAHPTQSARVFDILWKGCLASALLILSLRSRADVELVLFSVVLACGFVAYEVIFAGEGGIIGGRLEVISFPGAQGANATAAVLSMGLILASYFAISFDHRPRAIASLILSPFILETILRCNSRGSYLGLIASGICILFAARGPDRRRAMGLLAVGGLGILLLANDANIWNRFDSIFSDAEDRDDSAAERLLYWQAAIRMISDYPVGSGGEAAFKSPLGVTYIAHFRPEFRSVHSGPLDITASWGLQGFALLACILAIGTRCAIVRARSRLKVPVDSSGFLSAVLLATLAGQVVCCMFTSVLDGEWFLWLSGCAIAVWWFPASPSATQGRPSREEAATNAQSGLSAR